MHTSAFWPIIGITVTSVVGIDVMRNRAGTDLLVTVRRCASADFDGIGLGATNVRYRAKVQSSASPEAIAELLRQTDAVAEVHNTLRAGTPVQLITSRAD